MTDPAKAAKALGFFLFVLETMVWSVLLSAVLLGILGVGVSGHPGTIPLAVFFMIVGAGVIIPLCLVVGLLPSGMIYFGCLWALRRRYPIETAVIWAARITTGTAGIVLTLVLSKGGQDWDGVGLIMGVIVPVAVLITPLIARRWLLSP